MIDLNPGYITYICSTMIYICEHAYKYNAAPVLTFDQPLWLKAVMIQKQSSDSSNIRSIVLRLGSFHTEMSYLGAVHQIMSGLDLDILGTVYANNSVVHTLSGKVISRAVRGHLLVRAVLYMLLMNKIF